MAQRIVLVDDLDGTEDDTVETRRFSFEGVVCELELSAANWGRLYAAVKPFLDVARQDGAVNPPQIPAQRLSALPRGIVTPTALRVLKPSEPVVPVEVAELPELPLAGGWGEYAWQATPDSRRVWNQCYAEERRAAQRWAYSFLGKSKFNGEVLAAFRARDARLIPGWAPVPDAEDVSGTVGKELVAAVARKRAG